MQCTQCECRWVPGAGQARCLQEKPPLRRNLRSGGYVGWTFRLLICFAEAVFFFAPSMAPPHWSCPVSRRRRHRRLQPTKHKYEWVCGILRLLTTNNNSDSEDNRTGQMCFSTTVPPTTHCQFPFQRSSSSSSRVSPASQPASHGQQAVSQSVSQFTNVQAWTNKYLPWAYHD